MSVVIVERPVDGVALVRLNRPDARNALNMELRHALVAELEKLAADQSVRAVVLTGNEQAFAAGADLKEMAELGAIAMQGRGSAELWDRIGAFAKPLIAAINGFALGGGCELALHADIIIAGEGAKFGQPEVKVGIMAGGSGTQRLVRAIGKFKAELMLLTGDIISAKEASDWGLVSRVVPDADVVPHALEIARRIAANAPLGVRFTKEVVTVGEDAPLSTALALERKALYVLFASEDQKEGMRAFLEKRKPVFKGR
ncbi:MAG: enoyl-CoA hydratase [Hyphomicrobiaceae bacterium]|nr:MAG: enoyl-CoA hydratase [Hyphomicrobiaceae bacterium]